MNIPIFVVACACLLAVIAHIFGGTAETAKISPNSDDEKLVQSWKQAMCAFQMLAVDLLAITVVLFVISLTDFISFERELILFIALIFFLWGVVWLIQLLWLRSEAKTYIVLPQWILWFVCTGLLYWGSKAY